MCNGLDLISTTPDTVPPAAIADLTAPNVQARQVTLQWMAPADDNGTWGKAASYDVRYATGAITDANWDVATPVAACRRPLRPASRTA